MMRTMNLKMKSTRMEMILILIKDKTIIKSILDKDIFQDSNEAKYILIT